MLKIKRHFDPGSLVVIIITFVMFVIALFTKGLTHDILLEAAVFLVSVKLIMMSYHNVDLINSVHKRLDDICTVIKRIESYESTKKSND